MWRTTTIGTLLTLLTANAAFGFACITTRSGQCIHWEQHAATVDSFLAAPPSPPLANGTATWDENVTSAANDWTTSGANFHFDVAVGGQFINPCGPQGGIHTCTNTGPIGNNPVFFSSTFCGTGFGDILELVNDCWVQNTGAILNAPVFVNSAVAWNAYDGPLQFPNGEIVYDIRRVLLHELGHVLGLDHPDGLGQNVRAIMNSQVSNLDRLQRDDRSGIVSLYGGTPPSECAGDCDGNSQVQIDEIIKLINIVFGSLPLSACDAGDLDHSGDITVDEVIAAVNSALSSCPAAASPQVTGMTLGKTGTNAIIR